MRCSKINYYIFVVVDVLRKLAYPISLIYALVVYMRNFLYDVGIFKSKSFSTPTICVGNLSVGGTGKTPMVEFLISNLQKDAKVAVLSRGYKRKSKGFVLANQNTTVEDLGDEPFQIHSKFSQVIVAVDVDRRNGISNLEKNINDWYLPTGDLRDSKKEARRANFIVVTKCPPDLSKEDQKAIVDKLQAPKEQEVFFASIAYDNKIKGLNSAVNLETFRNKKVVLITGIANPKPLVDFLNQKDIAFEHLAYKDHHFFTPDELSLFNSKEIILTTEKDYVRLKGQVENLYYISIKHEFFNDGDKVLIREMKSLLN